jgi:Transglycosylase SLT domain
MDMDKFTHSASTAVWCCCHSGNFRHILIYLVVGVSLLFVSRPSCAQSVAEAGQADFELICPMLESAARANALPIGFFARLIWRESHFHSDAIGPQTRSGAHALGIAQFMPETAVERQLVEPFDPKQALSKSSAFLAELRDEFGNLGLAAAAYNAGPQRVRDFLAGARDMPEETRGYVLAITGQTVEHWTEAGLDLSRPESKGEPQIEALPTNCRESIATMERASWSLKALWLQTSSVRSVPSWCRGLSHPNIKICGPIHAPEPALRAASAHVRSKLDQAKSSL